MRIEARKIEAIHERVKNESGNVTTQTFIDDREALDMSIGEIMEAVCWLMNCGHIDCDGENGAVLVFKTDLPDDYPRREAAE